MWYNVREEVMGMVDIKKCYFHSLNLNSEKTLELLEKIIKDGKILSLEKSGAYSDGFRMNTRDEICISKKSPFRLFYNSAYGMYAREKLSFILKGDLPGVYKPELIPVSETFGGALRYVNSGLTDMYDEYRVRDEISLDQVIGINIPVSIIIDNIGDYKWFFLGFDESFRGSRNDNYKKRVSNTREFYNRVVEILESNGIDLPIYDIEARKEIKSELDIGKVKKKRK